MKKTFNIFKRLGRRNLALAIAALMLCFSMLTGVTYSWIESITAVEITNNTGSDTTKQGIEGDILSTVKIKNCGKDGANLDSTQGTNWADLGKHFYEAGDMHLATCSGDGESFYFTKLKGSEQAKPWRLGTEDDENVNYISGTFKIEVSDEADVDFWFKEVPSVKIGGTNVDIAYYSFTVDGETKVYRNGADGTYKHINNAGGETTAEIPVESAAKYTFGDASNVNPADANDINTNTLFSIPKGTTKNVTVRIWLQDSTGEVSTYTGDSLDIDMKLVSTWAVTRRIRIFDGTSDKDREHWIYNDSAKMWLALSSDPVNYHWELNVDDVTHYGYVDIPSYYYQGNEICIYRCDPKNNNGWNSGNITYNGIDCWNYWATELPKGFKNETFNILGNTPFANNQQNDIGYIYWGDVERVTVDASHLNFDNGAVRMIVHDADTELYYSMHPDSDKKQFSAYIPKSSDKIEFRYKSGGFSMNQYNSSSGQNNCYKNEGDYIRWGYRADDSEPQKRPLGDTTYTIISDGEGTWEELFQTEYRLAGYFNGSSDWKEDIIFYKYKESDELAFASVNLNADSLHPIKIMKVTASGNEYYSNEGVMSRSDSANWEMKTTVSPDMGLISGESYGCYKFWLNTTNMQLTVSYPGGGGASRIYLVTTYDGYDKYAYMWNGGNNNGAWPGQKMDYLGTINSRHIYKLNYKDNVFPNKVKFSGRDGSTQKWESGDLDFSNSYQLFYIV